MAENDELTARQVRGLVVREWPDVDVSISTIKRIKRIKRIRKQLGWIPTTPKHCQLIRDANKEKRLDWCKQCVADKDEFNDVIFSDE